MMMKQKTNKRIKKLKNQIEELLAEPATESGNTNPTGIYDTQVNQ